MPEIPDGEAGPGGWLAAGWLSGSTRFPTGPVGEPRAHRLCCERLFEACRSWVHERRPGHRTRARCPGAGPDRLLTVERHGRAVALGRGEVRAVAPDGGRWAPAT